VSGNTFLAASFNTARLWLEKCISKHRRCNANAGPEQILPNRVIDVGASDSKGTVKLVETLDGQRGKYLCLSHCWGKEAKPFQTTSANLEQLKQVIQESELTKTFQDAIDIVRRLGMRYIWIDSLCIIQDDHDDWRLHAKSMAAIYQNAYLTLAASFGSDGTAGCYSETKEYEATLVPGQSPNQAMYYRPSLPHFWQGLRSRGWGVEDENYPLLSRCWVFQEASLFYTNVGSLWQGKPKMRPHVLLRYALCKQAPFLKVFLQGMLTPMFSVCYHHGFCTLGRRNFCGSAWKSTHVNAQQILQHSPTTPNRSMPNC